MSFVTALKSGFKNFGHAMAVAAKGISVGVTDVVKVAAKAQVVAPEVELLAAALAGPVGAKVADIGFHLLGDVANAIQKTGADAKAVSDTGAVNLVVDAQLVNDLKALLPTLIAIAKSGGQTVPPAA